MTAVAAVESLLAILITWWGYALICTGLGAWFPRLFRTETISRTGTFWAGVATLLAILQLWHFFAPITIITHVLLLMAGILGLATLPKTIAAETRIIPPARVLVPFLLLALFLANRATGPCAEYDSGLYHIPAINWTKSYAIVPGLANLHMRFGFSSTLTLLAAFMDQGPWAGRANHILNAFLLLALAAMIFRSLAAVLKRTAGPADWLLVFSGVLVTDWALDVQASSYSTDIGVAVFIIVAAHYFLATFEKPLAQNRAGVLLAVLLAAAAVSIKASALVLSIPLIAIILARTFRTVSLRATLAPAIAAAILIIPWLARQSILSGYPLYPAEAFALPVDWRVPYARVHWLRRIILDWARWMSYDDSRNDWRWLTPWLRNRLLTPVNLWKAAAPALLAVIALPNWIVLLMKRRRTLSAGPIALFLCVAIAIGAWFTSAPDPRYASQIFVLFMAGSLILLRPSPRIGLALAALLAIGPLAMHISSLWISPPSNGQLFWPTPQSEVVQITTPAGLTVWIPQPAPGPTYELDRAWNAPLPNAPLSEIDPAEVPLPPLQLRHPPDLQSGFNRAK